MQVQDSDLHQRFLYLLDRVKAMQAPSPVIAARDTVSNPDGTYRETPRQRCQTAGRISYAGGDFEVDCNVIDLSDQGARLQLVGDVAVPLRFDLEIPAKSANYKAEKRWQNGVELGVEFV